MRSLDQAIARTEAQLRFIPTAPLRQMRILALLNEQTSSDRSWIYLNDDMGRFLGGILWPPINPLYWKSMSELGPAYAALELCNDLHEHHWDSRPGVAFALPDALYHNSLLYQFVYGPLNSHHTILCGYPARRDGQQVVVIPVRGRERPPYTSVDFRALEKICGHFSTELSDANPPDSFRPRHAVAGEHTTELDAQLRPAAMPLNLQALLAFFYGSSRTDVNGRVLLPALLEADLRRYRDDKLRPAQREKSVFHQAFTKPHRGRVLCLVIQSRPDGTYSLDLHEDQSQHERLRQLKSACRALPRGPDFHFLRLSRPGRRRTQSRRNRPSCRTHCSQTFVCPPHCQSCPEHRCFDLIAIDYFPQEAFSPPQISEG